MKAAALIVAVLTATASAQGTRPATPPEPRVEAGPVLSAWVYRWWIQIANFQVTQPMRDGIAATDPTATILEYPNGAGSIHTDFMGVTVTLPPSVTPTMLLTWLRDDPGRLGTGHLRNNIGWPAMFNRPQYSVANLDIPGPDNGPIGYIDTDVSDGQIQVVTLSNDTCGTHPVYGTRVFGVLPMYDGTHLVYTYAIEAAGVWGTGGVGASIQHDTWLSMVWDVGEEIIMRGGKAHAIFNSTRWQPGDLKPGSVKPRDVKFPEWDWRQWFDKSDSPLHRLTPKED